MAVGHGAHRLSPAVKVGVVTKIGMVTVSGSGSQLPVRDPISTEPLFHVEPAVRSGTPPNEGSSTPNAGPSEQGPFHRNPRTAGIPVRRKRFQVHANQVDWLQAIIDDHWFGRTKSDQ